MTLLPPGGKAFFAGRGGGYGELWGYLQTGYFFILTTMDNMNVIEGRRSAMCRVAASGRKKRSGRKAAADVGFLATIDLQIAELQEQQLFGRANG